MAENRFAGLIGKHLECVTADGKTERFWLGYSRRFGCFVALPSSKAKGGPAFRSDKYVSVREIPERRAYEREI
jgi:hypothetical protein